VVASILQFLDISRTDSLWLQQITHRSYRQRWLHNTQEFSNPFHVVTVAEPWICGAIPPCVQKGNTSMDFQKTTLQVPIISGTGASICTAVLVVWCDGISISWETVCTRELMSYIFIFVWSSVRGLMGFRDGRQRNSVKFCANLGKSALQILAND
jgi:hypothetical protein